jgi:hypothetical protein
VPDFYGVIHTVIAVCRPQHISPLVISYFYQRLILSVHILGLKQEKNGMLSGQNRDGQMT